MASFNQVTLLGNVTREPMVRQLPSNTTVAEWGMAMNHKYKTADGEQREDVCFVDCTAFGRSAEVIAQYVTKGKPLLVSGRLRYDQWEDKNGGGKRSKLTVVVDNFQFVGGRDGGEQQSGGQQAPPVARRDPRAEARQRATVSAGAPPYNPEDQQFKDDDIPF